MASVDSEPVLGDVHLDERLWHGIDALRYKSKEKKKKDHNRAEDDEYSETFPLYKPHVCLTLEAEAGLDAETRDLYDAVIAKATTTLPSLLPATMRLGTEEIKRCIEVWKSKNSTPAFARAVETRAYCNNLARKSRAYNGSMPHAYMRFLDSVDLNTLSRLPPKEDISDYFGKNTPLKLEMKKCSDSSDIKLQPLENRSQSFDMNLGTTLEPKKKSFDSFNKNAQMQKPEAKKTVSFGDMNTQMKVEPKEFLDSVDMINTQQRLEQKQTAEAVLDLCMATEECALKFVEYLTNVLDSELRIND